MFSQQMLIAQIAGRSDAAIKKLSHPSAAPSAPRTLFLMMPRITTGSNHNLSTIDDPLSLISWTRWKPLPWNLPARCQWQRFRTWALSIVQATCKRQNVLQICFWWTKTMKALQNIYFVRKTYALIFLVMRHVFVDCLSDSYMLFF